MDFPLLWAEVDLKAIAHNVRELRSITNPSAMLMAVVKANAYGHGMINVSRQALQNGAELLGVARINEGIQLRNAGFDVPVLIFGYTPPDLAKKLIEFDLTQTIYSHKTAEVLSTAATSSRKKIKVHIKVDTGMGRVGILPGCSGPSIPGKDLTGGAVRDVESVAGLQGLDLKGIFTHFATAGSSDKSYAKKQFEIFMDLLDQLRHRGLEAPVTHVANSAAIIDMPETHLDMVRAGISVYGLYPSSEVNKSRIVLRPAMELKTRVIHLKKVPAGFRVSYGATYQTEKPTTIATVSVGYADGLSRLLSSRGHMLVRGHRASIVGCVCMDLTMLDVGHIPGVDLGDEVIIFGKQGDSFITVDEIASTLNTINYEIVSTIAGRVPRLYCNISKSSGNFRKSVIV